MCYHFYWGSETVEQLTGPRLLGRPQYDIYNSCDAVVPPAFLSSPLTTTVFQHSQQPPLGPLKPPPFGSSQSYSLLLFFLGIQW